jgi:hypothetical protein
MPAQQAQQSSPPEVHGIADIITPINPSKWKRCCKPA